VSNFIQDNSSDFSDMAKQKIAEFNALHWDASLRQPLGLKKLNERGEPVAALAGRTFGNWLYVESLWLAESERGLGTGRAILAEAEALARGRGCRFVLLDTLGFQARPFYEKQGYTVQWTQQDYPFAGGAKYFMVKVL
jgi:GNAT superfamily N-acetyltransferase